MDFSVEHLSKLTNVELIAAYHELRRQYVEARFTRDTQRARLEWLKAKAFAAAPGGISERKNAAELSDELARKGQEVREMTRGMDLLKADVDVAMMMLRLRDPSASHDLAGDDDASGEARPEHGA